MSTHLTLVALTSLTLLGAAPGPDLPAPAPVVPPQAATVPPAPTAAVPGPAAPGWTIEAPPDGLFDSGGTMQEVFWLELDPMLLWVRGVVLPPLVTTSPAGTPQAAAGVLPAQTLFGADTVNSGIRLGGRIDTGFWLASDQSVGFEGNYLVTEGQARNFIANSTSNPILARPFFNVASGAPASELIAFPGVVNGQVVANADSSSFSSAEALIRGNVVSGAGYRLDVVGGYRYMHYSDNVGINENLISTSTTSPVAPGTNIVVNDSFFAANNFQAFEWGFIADLFRGRWSLDGVAKVAVGFNSEDITINGSTTVTAPGTAPVTSTGGLLALSSNIGQYHLGDWMAAGEFGLHVGFQVNQYVRLHAGYTMLYWPETVRAGNQIDTNVNPSLIPPVTATTAPLSPMPQFHETSLWVQGVEFGVEVRY